MLEFATITPSPLFPSSATSRSRAGITVSGIAFTDSNAGAGTDGGVALIENSDDVAFVSCAFRNASAGRDDGAIAASNSDRVTIADSVATDVSAAAGRGGFAITNAGLEMINTNVTGAVASLGGAVFLSGGDSAVSDSALLNCTAGFGGCIYVDAQDSDTVDIAGVTIDGASAGLSGGGLFVDAGYLRMLVGRRVVVRHLWGVYPRPGLYYWYDNTTLPSPPLLHPTHPIQELDRLCHRCQHHN